MSRGQSMLPIHFLHSCNSRDIMMGSMDLIIEEEEDSDEYEEGEILVISDSEESEEEGDVSEEEVEREIHIEENLNEARNTEEEPRTVSTGRSIFPPLPPREMTYAEFRALAIEQEWQEALAYAMRIPDFNDI
eukprot:sb/3474920/